MSQAAIDGSDACCTTAKPRMRSSLERSGRRRRSGPPHCSGGCWSCFALLLAPVEDDFDRAVLGEAVLQPLIERRVVGGDDPGLPQLLELGRGAIDPQPQTHVHAQRQGLGELLFGLVVHSGAPVATAHAQMGERAERTSAQLPRQGQGLGEIGFGRFQPAVPSCAATSPQILSAQA